ncbi:MAG: tripartite tricarboxylate transporter substrate binding protein, partial [Limnohabitans sp.]|nr:tripartite tricarboxylate transporter substrate binding protein [Limnohabitans sp.]
YLVSTVLCLATTAGYSIEYPTKSVRIIVPAGPGTALDIGARVLAEKLSKSMGQSFVVENRPGGATTIGMAAVASAPADGHTLLVNGSSLTTIPSLMKNLNFSVQRDLVPVSLFAELPLVLVTNPSSGFKTVKDLVAEAKAKPGAITFGSAGVGTVGYLAAEKFRLAAGFQALHIPFKSTTDALTEVMAGRIHYLVTSTSTAIGPVRDGRLTALAMGFKRLSAMPSVPTFNEAGVQNAETNAWVGLFAPSKTPREIVARLHHEINMLMSNAQTTEQVVKAGLEPFQLSLEEVENTVKREFVDNEKLIGKLGIKPE